MAITTATITGTLYYPDGTTANSVELLARRLQSTGQAEVLNTPAEVSATSHSSNGTFSITVTRNSTNIPVQYKILLPDSRFFYVSVVSTASTVACGKIYIERNKAKEEERDITELVLTNRSVAGTGDALTSDPLSQFAATTSAQLAGVMSDETGTGKLVFGTAPTFASTIAIGTASSATGIVNLIGTTSGTVSLSVADAAGTWTMKLPTSGGTNGHFLQTNGSGVTTWAAASASPGGSDTHVQYNNSSAFGGIPLLQYDGSHLKLTNNNYLYARNAANNADIKVIGVNASDKIILGSYVTLDDTATPTFTSAVGVDGQSAAWGKGHYTGFTVNSSDGVMTVIGPGAATGLQVIAASTGTSPVVRIPINAVGQLGLKMEGVSSQTADFIQCLTSGGTEGFLIDKNCTPGIKVNAAPADGDVDANQLFWWFDSTNGAAKAMFKGKSANGTVVTGSVTLS